MVAMNGWENIQVQTQRVRNASSNTVATINTVTSLSLSHVYFSPRRTLPRALNWSEQCACAISRQMQWPLFIFLSFQLVSNLATPQISPSQVIWKWHKLGEASCFCSSSCFSRKTNSTLGFGFGQGLTITFISLYKCGVC